MSLLTVTAGYNATPTSRLNPPNFYDTSGHEQPRTGNATIHKENPYVVLPI
jgi:hypothetical protein